MKLDRNFLKAVNDWSLKLLPWGAAFTIVVALLFALPSLLVDLGLPPEGDAVDYRIPVIKWMARHHAYPNWNWTYIDDYPMLGELLMLPFFLIGPSLVRLVSIAAYVGVAVFGGLIFGQLIPEKSERDKKLYMFVMMSWILALRPLAIQSNLIMNDNMASCFVLGTLYFVLRKRVEYICLFAALFMATRYTVWGASAALFFSFAWICTKDERFKKLPFLVLGCVLGALPFLIRNSIVNGNPVYPLLPGLFGQDPFIMERISGIHYGRGSDLLSFLILPFDLLITNEFVKNLYDYTLGKHFLIQVVLFLSVFLIFFKKARAETFVLLKNRTFQSMGIFSVLFLLVWFFASQQMRFLVPVLVVGNVVIFYFCSKFFT